MRNIYGWGGLEHNSLTNDVSDSTMQGSRKLGKLIMKTEVNILPKVNKRINVD